MTRILLTAQPMKLYITTLFALTALAGSAQKQPDTSKRPHVYWSELINLQNANRELQRRVHRLDIPALRRDTIDNLSAYIGNILSGIYKRTYADTGKKVAGKTK